MVVVTYAPSGEKAVIMTKVFQKGGKSWAGPPPLFERGAVHQLYAGDAPVITREVVENELRHLAQVELNAQELAHSARLWHEAAVSWRILYLHGTVVLVSDHGPRVSLLLECANFIAPYVSEEGQALECCLARQNLLARVKDEVLQILYKPESRTDWLEARKSFWEGMLQTLPE